MNIATLDIGDSAGIVQAQLDGHQLTSPPNPMSYTKGLHVDDQSLSVQGSSSDEQSAFVGG